MSSVVLALTPVLGLWTHRNGLATKTELMTKFIELKISEDDELKTVLVNIASVGRVYANPQSRIKSIVELNYHSINDAPVYLEVAMPYETLRLKFLEE